jgi:RimK-like ATP-grasp domain
MGAVLIVANPEDLHAQFAQRALAVRNREVHFLHIARFSQTATLSFCIANPMWAQVVDSDTLMDFDDIEAVWYRRQGRPELPDDLADSNDQAFALREWGQALDGLLLSLDAKFVNPISAQRAAVKPRQLILAEACGLRIPATLITSDPAEAEVFIDAYGGRVVHKTMSAPRHQFAPTQRWRESDRSSLPNLVLAPSMFQEEIIGHSDVRATVIGERILAARIESSSDQVDSRLSPDAPCEPWRLPDDVSESLLETMEALGLVFGTVDLKITHEDDYVFLEVNPQGQFLYIEILTGLPITETLADLLAS